MNSKLVAEDRLCFKDNCLRCLQTFILFHQYHQYRSSRHSSEPIFSGEGEREREREDAYLEGSLQGAERLPLSALEPREPLGRLEVD